MRCPSRIATIALLFLVSSMCFAAPSAAQKPEGTIAFLRGGKTLGDEIRCINPDGAGERLVWKLPGPSAAGITSIAWRPDGKEIAFSSDHEAARSLYESDIYAIRPDGTGLRRLTNPPDPGDLARYPQGKVVVAIHNSRADAGVLIVYVTGASVGQRVTLPANGTKTLVFENVADFGAHPHPIVAISGKTRWVIPGPVVHGGQTVHADVLNITTFGREHYGMSAPVWRSDGSKVGFTLGGSAGLYWAPAHPAPGAVGEASIISGKENIAAHTFDWGPTPATADQIVYAGGVRNYAIRRTREGSGEPGAPLVEHRSSEYIEGVWWLPDASGILFSLNNFINTEIYRYDFADKQVKQLTQLEGDNAYNCSVSPNGRWIVFDRGKPGSTATNVWIMRSDGSDMRLLVKNAVAPVWGK